MKRQLLTLVSLVSALSLASAQSLYVTPEVPTEVPGGVNLLPAEIYRYAPAGTYTLELAVPGSPHVGGIHKLDRPGGWLFCVEEPNDLAGALGGVAATPRDVVRYDAGVYSILFCGATVGIPEGSKIDGLIQIGGDSRPLTLSFDVPTTIGAVTYLPADLVFFTRVGPGCGGWAPGAVLPTGAIPLSTNVLDADMDPGAVLLALDVPTTLGGTDFVPGQIVASSGGVFALYTTLVGWPDSSLVAGFSGLANPGRIPASLVVARSMTPGNLILTWSPSCSQGGETYGIYEGTLGTWYSHTMIDCLDDPPALTEEITPAAGNRYYLVVPQNGQEEGSYGTSSMGLERPVGTSACAVQTLTACP